MGVKKNHIQEAAPPGLVEHKNNNKTNANKKYPNKMRTKFSSFVVQQVNKTVFCFENCSDCFETKLI